MAALVGDRDRTAVPSSVVEGVCGAGVPEIVMARRTHGLSKTRAYLIWRKMVDRCTNSRHKSWAYYGGRGITVCKRWFVFENFLSDMGNPPLAKMLDRTNNNKGYEPSNCRWVTRKEQMRNKCNNKFLTLNGQTMCFAAWAEKLRVDPSHISRMARNQKAIQKAEARLQRERQ